MPDQPPIDADFEVITGPTAGALPVEAQTPVDDDAWATWPEIIAGVSGWIAYAAAFAIAACLAYLIRPISHAIIAAVWPR